MKYPCPECGKLINWQTSDFKPFCSERCKIKDFSNWANENYIVKKEEATKNIT